MRKLSLFKKIGILLVSLVLAGSFVGCDSDSEEDNWIPQHYVKFDKNYEGNSNDYGDYGTSYEEGTTVTFPSKARRGYKLLGYSENKDSTTAEYFIGNSFKVTKSITFYAIWEQITEFTITYNANYKKADETAAKTVTQEFKNMNPDDKTVLQANSFERENFAFLGWAKSSSATKIDYADEGSTDIFEDITLYAIWLSYDDAVKITYNINDGSSNPQEIVQYVKKVSSYSYDSVKLRKNTFVREGLVFAGWVKNKTSKSKDYSDEASLSTLTQDLTLYALWRDDNNYVVTFHSNFTDSTYSDIEQRFDKKNASGTLEANTFEQDGYVFYGWCTSKSLPTSSYSSEKFYLDKDSISLTGDKDLYAIWLSSSSSSSVQITYNANDGTETPAEKVQYLKYGSSYGFNKLIHNSFTRENYEFVGWSESKNATSKTYSDKESNVYVTANKTLYAVWKCIGPVTITFDANGGSDSEGNTTTTQTISANTSTATALKKNTFAKEGYSFYGWAKNSEDTYRDYSDEQSVSISDSELTLYAVWVKNPVITFIGNGGTTADNQTITTQTVPYETSTPLNENPFTNGAKTFRGWGKSETSSTSYNDKAEIYATSDITLYALWRNALIVTLDMNGGTGENKTYEVKYENSKYSFTFPEVTTSRDGYTFAGWGTSNFSTTASYKKDDIVTIYGDKTYYAVWKKNSVKITFDPNTANGGNGTAYDETLFYNVETGKYSGTLPSATTFSSSTSNFVGWSTTKQVSYAVVGNIMNADENLEFTDASDKIFYAVWNPKTYKITYDRCDGTENYIQTVENTAEYGQSMTVTIPSVAEPTPPYDYYTFLGWSTYSGESSATYNTGSSISISGDKTLYAVWKLGTILNETTSVSIASKSISYFDFTLLKTETLSISATSSSSLKFYTVNEENCTKIKNGENFNYYLATSGENTTSVNGNISLPAGKYYFVIANNNTSASTFKRTIKKY